jgi:long-chain fatty acid transport protein
MFFNAAALTRFQGTEFVGGLSFIKPSARLEEGSATRAAALGGTAISGSSTAKDAGQQAVVPILYAMWSLNPDLRLGLSLNSPFGLTSEYESGWIGRYHALKSTMTIVEIAPNVAWRLSPAWSIGGAVVARHVDAELSNAVDFGAIGAAYHVPGSVPGGQDGTAKVTGSRWGLGYKLGVLFEPRADFRLGAAYHSAIDFRLKGDVHYEGVPAALAANFQNGAARPMANQPATASLGAAWDAAPALTFQAEAARTFWTRFEDIRISFASGQKDSVTEEHWKDSWFFALGATWRPGGAWTLRTGVARDQTPTTDTFRTPRIPDAARTWVSLGAGYAFSRRLSVDLAYSHLFAQDSTLELQAGTPASPDFFRGNLSGTYRNKVDILAIQARCTF